MSRRAHPRLVIYTGLAAALLVGALASGHAALAAIAAPFALFVAIALASSWRKPPRVQVAFAVTETHLIERTPLEASLTFEATKSIRRMDVSLNIPEQLAPPSGVAPAGISVEASVRRVFDLQLLPRRWGTYDMGDVELRVHDALGLFVYEANADCSVALHVYPETEPIRQLPAPRLTRPFVGNQISRARGEGIELAEVRRYQDGDRLKHINWRASARTGELHVTDAVPDRSSDLILFLDGYSEAHAREGGTLDQLVRAAASIAQAALARHSRVGVITFGAELEWLVPSSGPRALLRIIESLIETKALASYRWHGVDELPPRTLTPQALVLALTPLGDHRVVNALLDLAGRGFNLAIIEISPLPYIPPLDGPTGSLAFRFWRLKREEWLAQFAALAVPVVTWTEGEPLDVALAEVNAFRRYTQRQHA